MAFSLRSSKPLTSTLPPHLLECFTLIGGSLSQVAEAASGVTQGSVLGPILFVVYVNDLTNNLTIDHLLYVDDVKLITSRKQADALQCSKVPLTSSTSPNAQPIQTVSCVRDLGLLLNTGFSADGNIARAIKKSPRNVVLRKAILCDTDL